MVIKRMGRSYELTKEEIFQAYNEQNRMFLIEDATAHVNYFCDCEELNSDVRESLHQRLNEIVNHFESEFDAEVDENTQWYNAVKTIYSKFVKGVL